MNRREFICSCCNRKMITYKEGDLDYCTPCKNGYPVYPSGAKGDYDKDDYKR